MPWEGCIAERRKPRRPRKTRRQCKKIRQLRLNREREQLVLCIIAYKAA
jgi:hypothetical protein